MITLIDKLNKKIAEEPYFLDENGEVIIEKVKTAAINLDDKLLSILLSDDSFKDSFFVESNGILIFDKVKFSWLISNSTFLPDSYTSYKNKIGLIDSDGNFLKNRDDVVLSFPFKDCVLEFDSTKEDEERYEVFLNEILAKDYVDNLFSKKVLVNSKIHDKNGVKSISSYRGENLVIKGNNLVSLYSLLPRYEGQVKLMYWDILFNTNNDLVPYNDSFKHSSWLTMMKNRIEVALKLLDKNGFFVIECDKNEDAYLTVLMDELIGRDHHICTISVKSNNISGNKTQHKEKTILKNKDSILVYSMSLNPTITPQYTEKTRWDTHYNLFLSKDENGDWIIEKLKDVLIREGIIGAKDTIREEMLGDKKFFKFIIEHKSNIARFVNSISPELKKLSLENKDKIVTISEDSNPVYAYNGSRISFLESAITKIRGEEKFSQLLGDLWTDIDFQNTQNEGGVSLPAGKKPEFLLQRIIEMFTKENDLILDAYFGSGTTGAVALKTNRRFIGLEQLESHYDKSILRLTEVINGDQSGISKYINWTGGGSFISVELAKENEKLVSLIASSSTANIMDVYEKIINNSNYLNYKIDGDALKKTNNREAFANLTLGEQKKLLIELLDKNLLYINYSDINDEEKDVSNEAKNFSKSFYGE